MADDDPTRPQSLGDHSGMGAGIAIGVGVGAALTPLLGPGALAIGISMGIAIGAALDHQRNTDDDASSDEE